MGGAFYFINKLFFLLFGKYKMRMAVAPCGALLFVQLHQIIFGSCGSFNSSLHSAPYSAIMPSSTSTKRIFNHGQISQCFTTAEGSACSHPASMAIFVMSVAGIDYKINALQPFQNKFSALPQICIGNKMVYWIPAVKTHPFTYTFCGDWFFCLQHQRFAVSPNEWWLCIDCRLPSA